MDADLLLEGAGKRSLHGDHMGYRRVPGVTARNRADITA